MKDKKRPQSCSMAESRKVSRLVAALERLKKERKELEEKYRNTIEYANDAIITGTIKGIITSFDSKIRILGLCSDW